MRRKITLFVFTCLIARCCSQVTKCDIDDTEGILGWDTAIIAAKPINDNDVLDLKFAYRGDLQVEPSTEEEGAKYIDITADGSTFSIKTNDYFTNNYEENQKNQPAATSLTIYRTLSITCDGETYPFTLGLYVQDTNNHAPTFTQNTYTYTMPMPLVPNIDLTNFGEIEIIAEDIDFSNTKMTFTVQPTEYFDLDFKALASRQYHAVLKVTQYVRYDKDLTLTITATDETEPFHNVTATVVIKKDTEFSQPDIPTFSELIYAFTYSNDGGNPAITPDDPSKQIVVTTSDSDQTEVSLSDETYFKAEYDKATKIVAISVTDKPVESASESMMTLTLTVKLGSESSESAIIVKLPSNVVVIIPKFTAPYYTATYSVDGDGNPSLALDAGQEIAITQQASNLDIKLEGDPHFSIANVDGVWTLNADSPLEDEILKKGEDITLTLHATVTDENSEEHEGFGVVIVKLPPVLEVPRFVEANYRGQYKVDEAGVKDTVELTNGPIKIVQTDETVEIGIVDSDGHFTLIQDSEAWTVDVLKNWEQVTEGGNIVLTLSATVTGADVEPGYSTLIIDLPAATEAPTFDKPYYTATYKTDTDPNTLEMTDTINVAGGDGTVVNFLDSETYPDNFDIQCDDEGKCNLQLKAPLEDTVLTSEKEIILVLEASKEDTAATSTATVIISLPLLETLDAPEFTENVYVAPYVVDEETGEITINPDNPIQIKGETNLTGFELIPDGENVDHFAFIKKEDHWDVTNSKPLPDETLKNDVSILLNLKVTKLGVSVPGLAGLVIQLPKSTDPEILSFTQVAYIANYTVVTGNNNDVLDITNGPVKFDGVDDASTVKPDVVEDEYKDYFSITPETDGWTIAMLKDFSSEITDQISLTVTLKATLDDRSGECALVISLPKKVSPASFQFEFPTYRAEYEQDQDGNYKVSFEKSITLTGDAKDVTVDIDGDYATYFVETKTGNTVSIELNKDLPDDVLDKVAITLDIVASKSNEKATSTAVINLPRKVVPSSFYFDSGVYTGTYNEDDTFALDSDQKISLKGDIDHTATFAANGDYAGYFAVSYDGEEITVTLTKPLPSEVVEEKITIPVGIVATREGVDTPTTLVVKLPKNSAPATFYFEHSVYTVQYIDDDDSLVQPDINIEGDSDNKASVKLISSDYAKYFDAGYTNGAVKLTVKEPITDEIIAEKGAITVDLEATSPSDEVATATVVIELPKRNTAATFYFDSTIYEASYNDDGVTVNGSITLTGDSDSTATVEVQGEYADDFTVTYTDNTVELSLTKTLPSDVLDTYAAITVDIVATKGSETATTTVVITLPKKIVPASFSFNSTHYVGDYKVDDNGNTLAVSAISLKGETENVKVTLEGEYSDHFSVGYASGNVNITLKKPLDSDILDTKSAIPLDLKAVKADETVITTLVITLPKEASVGDSEDDKTGLIAAVAVLAVLLVASLVGSAVFYYFKFRRGSSYNDIDEGRPSERFRKNSTTDSKKVEHPTRRATGVIKYPLEEVAENGETPTEEMEPNLEKRKSVQFDTINIDELEIEKPEDDDNDFMGDSEAEDGDDTRRTSRV